MISEEIRSKFERVVESQLARIEDMKTQGDFIDYSKLDKIIIGAIMPMAPGVPLTTSIREIRVPPPETDPVLFDGLWFRSWSGPGWAAAVCGHSEPPENFFKKVLDIPTV